MRKTLLPTGSTALEKAASVALSRILTLPIPLRTLMNPETCPVHLLPYLAWSVSVDRWDKDWSEKIKREAIKDALFIHQHKGTISALRRVVEPLGYLIRVIEWWKTGDAPGTFRLDIGVLESGITESMLHEIEALIADAKPASRHLLGLSIQLETRGAFYTAAGVYLGDELTVYAYTPALISTSGTVQHAVALHLIDTVRITPHEILLPVNSSRRTTCCRSHRTGHKNRHYANGRRRWGRHVADPRHPTDPTD